MILGGDQPWTKRVIGVSTCPQVGSMFHEEIWNAQKGAWEGDNIPCTTEGDEAHYTAFLLGTPSLQAAGCTMQPMLLLGCAYTGEILATSSARLFPLGFDYPHIRFWHFAHNTNLRLGPVKYGKNSQILRRIPTECMCVYARFNIIAPAEALFVDAYHVTQILFCRQRNTENCLETDRSYQNLLHTDGNHKKLSRSRHKTRNLVKNYCIPQKELWSATKCPKKVTKDGQSREASRINTACMCV